MARIRQSGGTSGGRKVPHSLWERAGAQAGNGASALFARLDAQDAQDAHEAALAESGLARAQAAEALERVAAQIRAGSWNADLAALVAAALALLDNKQAGA